MPTRQIGVEGVSGGHGTAAPGAAAVREAASGKAAIGSPAGVGGSGTEMNHKRRTDKLSSTGLVPPRTHRVDPPPAGAGRRAPVSRRTHRHAGTRGDQFGLAQSPTRPNGEVEPGGEVVSLETSAASTGSTKVRSELPSVPARVVIVTRRRTSVQLANSRA